MTPVRVRRMLYYEYIMQKYGHRRGRRDRVFLKLLYRLVSRVKDGGRVTIERYEKGSFRQALRSVTVMLGISGSVASDSWRQDADYGQRPAIFGSTHAMADSS